MNSVWQDTIGLDPIALVDQIVNKGVSKYDAAKLINNLIAVNLQQAPRRFTFTSALPSSSTACAPTFTRSFAHQDWVDGESVVQAGESADDKGFNWRFNAVSTDLDALHADTERLYQCMASMQTALVSALQQVAAELNRLDTDVADVSTKTLPDTPFKVNVNDAPQFLGIRELDGAKVTMWKTNTGVVVLPGIDTVSVADTVGQRLGTGAEIMKLTLSNQEFAKDVAAGTSVADLITKFGSVQLDDGRTVAQALTVVPPNSTFPSTDALISTVNTQEQTVIRSTIGSIDAVGALTGVTSEGTPLAQVTAASIANSVTGAPAGLGSALTRAGLTMEQVAGLQPTALATSLATDGVQLTPVQAADLVTRASMISGLTGLTG